MKQNRLFAADRDLLGQIEADPRSTPRTQKGIKIESIPGSKSKDSRDRIPRYQYYFIAIEAAGRGRRALTVSASRMVIGAFAAAMATRIEAPPRAQRLGFRGRGEGREP